MIMSYPVYVSADMEKAELLSQAISELFCTAPQIGKDKKGIIPLFHVVTQLMIRSWPKASEQAKTNVFQTQLLLLALYKESSLLEDCS